MYSALWKCNNHYQLMIPIKSMLCSEVSEICKYLILRVLFFDSGLTDLKLQACLLSRTALKPCISQMTVKRLACFREVIHIPGQGYAD